MSNLVGPDGHTPLVAEKMKISYKAGGLRIDIDASLPPDVILTQALGRAQQAIGQQAAAQEMQKSGSQAAAQLAGQAAASGIRDPFTMEPCALAIFMYMSRELEYRDRVIEDMAKRLDALDGGETKLEHPYPPSEKMINESNGQADRSDKN
jgi:hypothetical protein